MSQSAIRTAVRNVLLASSALGASLVTAPVVAQEQLEEIVITGSRIARNELDATIPMVAIDSAQLASQGFENFADIATQLPQFAPSFGASRTQSTFSGVEFSGLNYANLRNLAGVRTLTLINGRRVPGGSSTSTAVDFNTLPTANIERIEVQTGGASAIYGADAVAGVVNIITKRGFEGLEVGASYGQSSDNDNINPGGYLMFGGTLGEGGHGLVNPAVRRAGARELRESRAVLG